MGKLCKVKVTASRSNVRDASKYHIVQPYVVASYYIHFQMAGNNISWELVRTNFLMSSSQHQYPRSRMLKDAMCTALCGSELLYPFSKGWQYRKLRIGIYKCFSRSMSQHQGQRIKIDWSDWLVSDIYSILQNSLRYQQWTDMETYMLHFAKARRSSAWHYLIITC